MIKNLPYSLDRLEGKGLPSLKTSANQNLSSPKKAQRLPQNPKKSKMSKNLQFQ